MKPDHEKKTPMDIALEQKSHQKCLLLAQVCLGKPNDYTHEALVQSIPKLMEEKYHDVVEYIFANMMTKTDTSELERFSLPTPKFVKKML